MKALQLKRVSLFAQYCLWSMTASSCVGMGHTRLIFFMIGLMILLSLSGMQLKNILDTFEKDVEKVLYVLILVLGIGLTLYFF